MKNQNNKGFLVLFLIVFLTSEFSLLAQQTIYPEFSWNHVPLYMHMRKSAAFTIAEIQYLSGFPLITLEKTTGSTTYGSTEEGSRAAARAIKIMNQNAKVLYYRNVMINYDTYNVNTGLSSISNPFLADANGNTLLHLGVREVYDLSNMLVRKWWTDHCVEMANYPEIDGIFLDANVKAISPEYLLAEIGAEKKNDVLQGYEMMMQDLYDRMNPEKIKLANLIRVTIPNSGLDYINYFDGSYIENFEGDRDYIAAGIDAVQQAARQGNIIAFCIPLGENLPVFSSDENGHIILSESLQKRMDFSLAMFLICAEEYSYFLLHDGYNVNPGVSKLWMKRFAEYDKPLGPPQGPAVKTGYVYTREFEHASVSLDLTQQKASIIWDSDPDPNPNEIYTIKFVIREAFEPVFLHQVLVELDSLSGLTNVAGEIIFREKGGNYACTITKSGFFPISNNLNIISDTIVTVPLYPSSADVIFSINTDKSGLPFANIYIDGKTVQTNSIGLASIQNLNVGESYSYSIFSEGFFISEGNFLLTKDTSINVILQPTLITDENLNAQIRIFPVPAKDIIMLESDQEMTGIRAFDQSGRCFYTDCIEGTKYSFIPDKNAHLFFIIIVTFKSGEVVSRTISKITG